MTQKITGEAPFQVLSTNFSIGPSQQNYVLQISADGTNYSDLFTVSAGQTKMVTNVANGSYYRLKNNNSEVTINWRTQCNDGQGGGGGSYILPAATEQTLGGIKVGSGLTVQADGTLSANGGADPEAIQEAIDANNTLIEEGDIVVGMAKQLYSPDGVTSEGAFAYRTTAGDEDVSTGQAELRKIGGNATFPEIDYNDSVVLMRNGSEVEGFAADVEWGDMTQWVSVGKNTDITSTYPNTVKARMSVGAYDTTYTFSINSNVGLVGAAVRKVSNGWTTSSYTNATSDPLVFEIKVGGVTIGTITVDSSQTYVTAELEGYYIYSINSNQNDVTYEILTGANIPNDIPYGETTYTYDGSDWDTALPQAIVSMTINGVDYVPQSGDELVVTRILSKTGNVSYPAPDSFVALGLNSFTKSGSPINFIAEENYRIGSVLIEEDDYGLYRDNDYDIYAIKAVTGLENGYIVYHKEGSSVSVAGVADKDIENLDISYSATVHTSTYDVVFPTEEFPYIVFSLRKDDEGTVCVHPRWSGYMDENYEDYTESILDISSFNTDCPLLSVGNVRNIWDFENSKLIQNIGVSTYSAQAVQDLIDGGKEIGVDFDFDENNIYEVLDEPIVTDITFENGYEANDFSVEYFAQDNGFISMPVYATTWYMNNLVDKLRRMEMNFVHLDNLSSEGEVGTTYEYQGRLMQWVEGSGYTAEWLKNIGQLSERNEGTGLIYAVIPDNTKLFEYKYPYGGEWRYVVYNDGKLYCTETGGTVVASASTGEEFSFPASQNGNIYQVRGIFKNGYIGFYKNGYISCQNVWNGSTNVGHFELIDKNNYPYIYNPNEGYIYGVNEKGQAVSKKQSFGTKIVYFNNTGYSNSMGYLTNGSNNGPDRMWVPTTGGQAGQTLVSAGDNSAPVWETRIKVVKITSDAYEALVQAGTTDPNTLYAIVDE